MGWRVRVWDGVAGVHLTTLWCLTLCKQSEPDVELWCSRDLVLVDGGLVFIVLRRRCRSASS